MKGHSGRGEQPAEMGQAVPAYGHPPLVSLEPGEFAAGLPDIAASRGSFETTDVKNKSAGIGKGVLMRVVNCDLLRRPGNCPTAVGAKQQLLPVFAFFLFRLAIGATGHAGVDRRIIVPGFKTNRIKPMGPGRIHNTFILKGFNMTVNIQQKQTCF